MSVQGHAQLCTPERWEKSDGDIAAVERAHITAIEWFLEKKLMSWRSWRQQRAEEARGRAESALSPSPSSLRRL